MGFTKKEKEIKKWVQDNVDAHGWVTHKMLALYAEYYHNQQTKKKTP